MSYLVFVRFVNLLLGASIEKLTAVSFSTYPQSLMSLGTESTSFESSLKELEKIVAELERGELSLENQLKSFEKGVSLSRECMKRLEEVERRVETLMQAPDGQVNSAPFEG